MISGENYVSIFGDRTFFFTKLLSFAIFIQLFKAQQFTILGDMLFG